MLKSFARYAEIAHKRETQEVEWRKCLAGHYDRM